MLLPRTIFLFLICPFILKAQEAADWTWIDYAIEGKITKMDAELAPRLREGMVFSAIYAFAADANAVDLEEAPTRARYLDVVDKVDLSIDVNYVLVYEAQTGTGDRWVELTRAGGDDPDAEKDLYSILLPLAGEPIGEEGWSARWLQVWFYGESGRLLNSTKLQSPPEDYETGWWRITFWNTGGTRSVLAEGAIEAAGEAGKPLTPGEQIAQLEEAVVRLGQRLEVEQANNAALSAELAQAQSRIEGLQKTVDVIVEERQILQNEYDLLKLEKTEASPELMEEVASMEAELTLWQERKQAWENENRSLAEALALAEAEHASLTEALREMEAKVDAQPMIDVREAMEISQTKESELPAETITEKSVIVETKAKKRDPVFRRPGKFRR